MSTRLVKQPHLLRPEEVIILSREIQAMVAAGVPLEFGMQRTAGGGTSRLEETARRLAERLEQGANISEACEAESSIPPTFRAVLVAGFRCGRSEEVLQDVSELSQMLVSLRQTLKLGLVYPLIVIFLTLVLLGVVASTMFPGMKSLYVQLHLDVPAWLSWATYLQFQSYHGLLLLGIFVIAMFWFWQSGRLSPLSGLRWIPGVAGVVSDFTIAQFSSLLALLVSYGVPLPEALRLTADSLPAGELRKQTFQVAETVERGNSIQAALVSKGAFPPFLQWLLFSGHQDSELPVVLSQAAEFYENRARSRAIWISQVVPASAVVLVGGTITLLYSLSVFGPMIDLWEKLAQS